MKMIRTVQQALWTLGVAVALAGCSSVKLDDKPTPVESRSTPSNENANASGNASSNQVANVDLASQTPAAASNNLPRIIYFDLDSFVVKDEFRSAVEAHAKTLGADRKKKLTIEGHTDERGGREYNLALGQKRAEAVAKSLELLGADAKQIESVSFGKERPAMEGSNEEAWAKNRRAELVSR